MREHRGLRYDVHPEVYEPAEDSFLLADAVLEGLPPGRVLEVGCGTGLVSLAAARRGARVVAVDVNPFAVRLARRNALANDLPFEVLRGDLLSGLRGDFDALLCNPPYLPTAEDDVPSAGRTRLFDAWEAGARGVDVVLRLLDELAERRVRARELWLLTSSLQDEEVIARRLAALGGGGRVIGETKVPWERLRVWKWNLER